MSPAHHHLKAYIVFLVVSLLLVGILTYLYTPFNIDTSKLRSEAVVSPEVQMSSEVILREETDTSSTATKRIRLTNLLLRYQKELSDLESTWDIPLAWKQEKLESVRQKIENLELMITELSQ